MGSTRGRLLRSYELRSFHLLQMDRDLVCLLAFSCTCALSRCMAGREDSGGVVGFVFPALLTYVRTWASRPGISCSCTAKAGARTVKRRKKKPASSSQKSKTFVRSGNFHRPVLVPLARLCLPRRLPLDAIPTRNCVTEHGSTAGYSTP